ncbi:MAG: hypothetical protein WAL72_05020 [Streptosporangiaceae bacterium]
MGKDMEQRLAALREEARRYDWTVEKGKRYYKMLCPCPGKHRKTMHLTPSDPRYELNLRKWLERQPCWGDTKETDK